MSQATTEAALRDWEQASRFPANGHILIVAGHALAAALRSRPAPDALVEALERIADFSSTAHEAQEIARDALDELAAARPDAEPRA